MRRKVALARARSSFLVDDRVEDGVVRDFILASWTVRSREWAIDIDGAELSAFDTESDSLLVRAARPCSTRSPTSWRASPSA